LCRFEWTRTAADKLWPRSQLGLILSMKEYQTVQKWLDNRALP